MRTEPVLVRAGPHRVTAAFPRISEGPADDLLSPHGWSIADRHTGMGGYGLTLLPHLRELVVGGPHRVTGISDHPVRERIFTCRPTAPEEQRACAGDIVTRLATEAYRRTLTDRDVEGLMAFFDEGAADGGFEVGVRTARCRRSSPARTSSSASSVRRLRARATSVRARRPRARGAAVVLPLGRTTGRDASPTSPTRGGSPTTGSGGAGAADARRRALVEALSTRFAAQWLRLQDLDKVHPDVLLVPGLRPAARRRDAAGDRALLRHAGARGRSVLELYTADWTVLNERLAEHYGIAGRGRRRVPPGVVPGRHVGVGSWGTAASSRSRPTPIVPRRCCAASGSWRCSWERRPRRRRRAFPTSRRRRRPTTGVPDHAGADGAAPGQPDVQRVPPLHRPDRPRARCFDVTGGGGSVSNGAPSTPGASSTTAPRSIPRPSWSTR
jgi:hypothetical protein